MRYLLVKNGGGCCRTGKTFSKNLEIVEPHYGNLIIQPKNELKAL